MATDRDFVQFIAGQIENAGDICYKKMFGEYAIYIGRKVVALVCDNQLYVKPTTGGREYIGNVVEASPYPGARVSFLIEEGIEDSDWLTELIRITEREVPEPKPKGKKI